MKRSRPSRRPKSQRESTKALDYTAIVIWHSEGETGKVYVGVSKAPEKLLREAQRFHWREVMVYPLVWTVGRPIAERLARAVTKSLADSGRRIRGHWYKADPWEIDLLIGAEAEAIGAEVMDTETVARRVKSHRLRQCFT